MGDAPSLESFQVRLDGALSTLIQVKMSLLSAGALDWMAFNSPSQARAFCDSMILPPLPTPELREGTPTSRGEENAASQPGKEGLLSAGQHNHQTQKKTPLKPKPIYSSGNSLGNSLICSQEQLQRFSVGECGVWGDTSVTEQPPPGGVLPP